LADTEKEYLKQLYQAMITNPEGFLQEIDNIDLEAVRERLGIPNMPADDGPDALDLLKGVPSGT